MSKPSPTEVYLEHHGVKGMKWGVRKSKKSTGVSRARGAMLDRNEVIRSRIKKQQANRKAGKVSTILADAVGVTPLGYAFVGRRFKGERANKVLSKLDAQDKLKVRDKLSFLNTAPIDMLISVRPKKG